MTIYTHGCTSCGVTGVLIRKVRKHHPDVEVINTRYEKHALKEHVGYMKLAGMPLDGYSAIVVNGDDIVRLDEWKP